MQIRYLPLLVILLISGCSDPSGPGGIVQFTPDHLTFVEGDTARIVTTLRDENGQEVPSPRFRWTSRFPDHVSVDGDGMLKALQFRPDTTWIIASYGSFTDSVSVWVTSLSKVQNLDALPRARVLQGKSFQMYTQVIDPYVQSGYVPTKWTSGNTSVVTIDADGAAVAEGPGEVVLTAIGGQKLAETTVEVVTSGYSLNFLGDLAGSTTYGLDLNDSGQVVGNAIGAGDTVAFRWTEGAFEDLGAPALIPGSSLINANGDVAGHTDIPSAPAGAVMVAINDSGDVAGYIDHPPSWFGQDVGPFVFIEGERFDLEADWHTINGMNGEPAVVGESTSYCGMPFPTGSSGVLWREGASTVALCEGGRASRPTLAAISDAGNLIGSSRRMAYVSLGGKVEGIGFPFDFFPRGNETIGEDINDAAQAVGRAWLATTPEPFEFGWIWQDGGFSDLTGLLIHDDWEVLDATGINASGQIVGTGRDRSTGEVGAILLTPSG